MAELKQFGTNTLSVMIAILTLFFVMEQAGCGYFASKDEVAELRRDMNEGFAAINSRFDRLEERFDRLEERFDRLEERFDRLEERFDRLEERFDRLEERLDRIEQNHINHLMLLHATKVLAQQPKPPGK